MNVFEKITKEDIQFLKELKEQLVSQDCNCTRNPVQFEIVYPTTSFTAEELEIPDGYCIILENGVEMYNVEDFKSYMFDNLPENIQLSIEDSDVSMQDCADILRKLGYDFNMYPYVFKYESAGINFLTRKDAENFIKANNDSFGGTLKIQANCNEDPVLEKLLNIILKFE